MHRRRLEGWLFVGNGNLDGDGLALPDVIGNGDSKAVFADKALNRLITAGAVCVQAKRAVKGQECPSIPSRVDSAVLPSVVSSVSSDGSPSRPAPEVA